MLAPAAIVFSALVFPQGLHSNEVYSAVSQPEQSVQQVLEDNRDAIMALPNVVGTGISRCGDELCIRVLVSRGCAGLEQRLDELLGATPYSIEQTEPLQALPAED